MEWLHNEAEARQLLAATRVNPLRQVLAGKRLALPKKTAGLWLAELGLKTRDTAKEVEKTRSDGISFLKKSEASGPKEELRTSKSNASAASSSAKTAARSATANPGETASSAWSAVKTGASKVKDAASDVAHGDFMDEAQEVLRGIDGAIGAVEQAISSLSEALPIIGLAMNVKSVLNSAYRLYQTADREEKMRSNEQDVNAGDPQAMIAALKKFTKDAKEKHAKSLAMNTASLVAGVTPVPGLGTAARTAKSIFSLAMSIYAKISLLKEIRDINHKLANPDDITFDAIAASPILAAYFLCVADDSMFLAFDVSAMSDPGFMSRVETVKANLSSARKMAWEVIGECPYELQVKSPDGSWSRWQPRVPPSGWTIKHAKYLWNTHVRSCLPRL